MFVIETARRLQSAGVFWPALLIVVKATMILAIARLFVAAVPRLSAGTKYVVLTLAMWSVVALPIVGFAVPAWRVAVFHTQPANTQPKEIGATGDEDDAPPTAVGAAITVAKAAGVVPEAKIHALSRDITLVKQSWQGFILLALAAGSIAFLLRLIANVVRSQQKARLSLVVTDAAVAIAWFHPLMWSLARTARAEAERAPDAIAPSRSMAAAVSVAAAIALILLVPLASVRLVAAPHEASTTIDVYADKEEKHSSFDLAKLLDTTDVIFAKYEQLTSKSEPETGKDWYQQAYSFHRHGKYEEAIAGFKQSVAHGYRVDDSMYNIACAYAQLGDAANSVKWLRDAIAAGYDDFNHIKSDDDFAPIRENAEFRELVVLDHPTGGEGRVDAALHRYTTLCGLPDADGQAWFSAGYDLLAMRRYPESIDAFTKAAEKGYKPATSYYNIACGFARKGDTDSALEFLQKALDEGFDSPDKFEDDRDLDNVRRDPRFADLKRMAGDLRLHASNMVDRIMNGGESWPDALPRFRALTAKYPGTGRSWFNLGFAALQAGDNRESIAAFQHALSLGYRIPTTSYDLACAYARSGQKAAAIDWLEKAKESGFELKSYIDNDSDLMSLRWEPRFRELRREVRASKED